MAIRTRMVGIALLLSIAMGAAIAQAGGIEVIPYTPSLDVSSMDRTIDPCEDFYQYSCGGWRQKNPIPSDQSGWSVYAKLHQDNLAFLRSILESASAAASRTDAQQKIGDFYAACMDLNAIDSAGDSPISAVGGRITKAVTERHLEALLAELHSGVMGRSFFGFEAGQDFSDASVIMPFVTAGGLGLPDRDYYLESDARSKDIRAGYIDHVARVLALAGDTPQMAYRRALAVMRIETVLARASLTRVERRDPRKLNHRLSLEVLQKLTPHFDWSLYLAARGLQSTHHVTVTEPRFVKAFDRILASQSSSDLSSYLTWHVLHASASHLSAAYRRENFAFYGKTLRGQAEEKPRWNTCVALIDQHLGDALGREFVAKAFSSDQKQATLRMTKQIEDEMRRDIESLSWMSAATKRQALVKLDSVVNKIGYPDRWRDYSALQIQGGDYFGNLNRATQFEAKRQLAKIGKPLDRSEWMMTPPTVNAYYDPQMNDINFPAGVLQPPLYDASLDDAPNYGDTGGTIGHELTHGFDDEGRRFDAKGNLTDWWTGEDAKAFEERAQCVVDQYAQYVVVDDIHINSRLTLGEDVADLGGLMLAYNAWKAQTAEQHLESRDGLTPEQRFFVGNAQWACENTRPESDRLQAKTDPHSPGRYRVNGLVVNMPEFERAFACHRGQAMVRENRCRVW